jgi:hypothetical protein
MPVRFGDDGNLNSSSPLPRFACRFGRNLPNFWAANQLTEKAAR